MSRDLTDALSKLFIKLGGKLSDSKENKGPVDYIDDITDIVEPGGGDNNFIVTFTIDWPDDADPTITADKTFEEVKNAFEDGKMIFAKTQPSVYQGGDIVEFLPVDFVFMKENDEIYLSNINITKEYITIFTNNSVIISQTDIRLDPDGCQIQTNEIELTKEE